MNVQLTDQRLIEKSAFFVKISKPLRPHSEIRGEGVW